MKIKGAASYIAVSLKDLKKIYDKDAVIPVSKKFLDHFKMISGQDENLDHYKVFSGEDEEVEKDE